MKILITGYMGLIGRHVAREMKAAGHDVHGTDVRSGMDCRETFVINDVQYDIVFHCAADFPPARRLGTDADLIHWVDRTNPRKLVYISSEEVYPKALQQEPQRMDPKAQPDTAQGWALWTIEQMVLQRDGLVFRPFQVYGEGGRGTFDEVAAMVKEQRDPFVMSGCGQVADYLHVEDAVGAVLAAVEQDYKGPPIDLCSGLPYAKDELAEAMFAVAKWKPKKFQCALPDSSYFLCGDPVPMHSLRPPQIDLNAGIRKELFPTSVS